MIKVDETKCIGCGACVAISPENFDFNDAGLSKVVGENITDTTNEAAASCPVGAIEVTEGEIGTPASMVVDEEQEVGGEDPTVVVTPTSLEINETSGIEIDAPTEETPEEK